MGDDTGQREVYKESRGRTHIKERDQASGERRTVVGRRRSMEEDAVVLQKAPRFYEGGVRVQTCGGRDMSGRLETRLLMCGGVVEARGEGRRRVAGVEKAARQYVGDLSGIQTCIAGQRRRHVCQCIDCGRRYVLEGR